MKKTRLILAIAACTTACLAACATPEVSTEAPTEAPTAPSHEDAMHGEDHSSHHAHNSHNHRFADPSKYAERWNDPARDEWQKPDELIALMEIEPGMTVADLGAGTGYMLPHLSRAVGPEGRVLALDGEQAMITYLEENISKLGANVVPTKVPFDTPGLEAGSLDRLVTINTWHHVEGRAAYAAKVHDALRPGGRFVVVEFTLDAPIGAPKPMRIDSATVTADLEAAGFEVSIAEETMPNHHVVIGVK